jgi:hypothetical protein
VWAGNAAQALKKADPKLRVGGLVNGWATRGDDGTLSVLLWNATLERQVTTDPSGAFQIDFELPMPALSLVEFLPEEKR